MASRHCTQPAPALRDIQLTALYRFSPTGRRGVHTLQMQTRGHGAVSLGQRERVVLHQVLAHPDTRLSKAGSFVGEVREADLDKTRMHLRGVAQVGTLRCVMPTMGAAHVREMWGARSACTGSTKATSKAGPGACLLSASSLCRQPPVWSRPRTQARPPAGFLLPTLPRATRRLCPRTPCAPAARGPGWPGAPPSR